MTFNYLESFRKQIDRVDREILFLVKRRFNLAKKIGKYKIDNNIEIEDLNREDEVIRNVLNQAGMMDLNSQFARELFNNIMEESKKEQLNFIEHRKKQNNKKKK